MVANPPFGEANVSRSEKTLCYESKFTLLIINLTSAIEELSDTQQIQCHIQRKSNKTRTSHANVNANVLADS